MQQPDDYDDADARRTRIARIGATPSLMLDSADRRTFMTLVDYPAFEGEFALSDKVMLHLNVGRSGRIRRRSEAQKLDAVMRSGMIGIGVPDTAGQGGWDALKLLAVGLDLSLLADDGDAVSRADAFVPIADRLHDDPLLVAVATAMWRDAEIHGLGSAFFDHAAMLVGRRLLSPAASPAPPARIAPLSAQRVARIIARIEDGLTDDIGVADLAAVVGMSRHHFGRALKASCGLTPFALITERRMLRARDLLSDDALTITAIAALVGYTNPGKFAEAFRRMFGMTPSQWRSTST